MDFEGVPAPWDTILALIVGPVGAFVMMGLAVYFVWKLFREAQHENKANMATVRVLTTVLEDLKDELQIWREAGMRSMK
jgi:hypothetical protein